VLAQTDAAVAATVLDASAMARLHGSRTTCMTKLLQTGLQHMLGMHLCTAGHVHQGVVPFVHQKIFMVESSHIFECTLLLTTAAAAAACERLLLPMDRTAEEPHAWQVCVTPHAFNTPDASTAVHPNAFCAAAGPLIILWNDYGSKPPQASLPRAGRQFLIAASAADVDEKPLIATNMCTSSLDGAEPPALITRATTSS